MTGTATGMMAQCKHEKLTETRTLLYSVTFWGARGLALSATSHSVAGSARCGRAWRGTSGESRGCCGLKDRGGFAVAGRESVGCCCKVTNPQLVDCKTQPGQSFCPAESQSNKSKTREQK